MAEYNSWFQRIEKMVGTDAGFFLLATHSFIEGYIIQELDSQIDRYVDTPFNGAHHPSFKDYLDGFQRFLQETQRISLNSHIISQLRSEHNLTSQVRHSFASVSDDLFVSAAQTFAAFCKNVDLQSPVVEQLEGIAGKAWRNRESLLVLRQREAEERIRLQSEIEALKKASAKEVTESKAQATDAQQSVYQLAEQNKSLLEKFKKDHEKIDHLRSINFSKDQELRKSKKVQQQLLELSMLSRSQRDFEASLMQLSTEQTMVLHSLKDDNDYFIKGGAGTGKTLVLLEALKKSLASQDLIGMDQLPYGLVTFTKVLTKYAKYMGEILQVQTDRVVITNVDQFLHERLRIETKGEFTITYDSKFLDQVVDQAMQECIQEGQTIALPETFELKKEIEDFIWGYHLTQEEYVNDRYSRKGLSGRLSQADRELVWSIQEEVSNQLIVLGQLPKNLAIRTILRFVEEDPDSAKLFRTLYIDEVQDLPPVFLLLLKTYSNHLVMAGDVDQMIYGTASPFARVGIDLRGRTKILNFNFRNSQPMVELAEEFKRRTLTGRDRDYSPVALRKGPPVLFFRNPDGRPMEVLEQRLDYFMNDLGYDPSNILILSFLNKDIPADYQYQGHEIVRMNHETFDFKSTKGIRFSTIHSAKGLDSPVVLLYFPRVWIQVSGDTEVDNELVAHLLYVALTRGFDHLEIIVGESFCGSKQYGAARVLLELVEG